MVEGEPKPSVLKCVHRWKIDSPLGNRYSEGRCDRCADTRLFDNAGGMTNIWRGLGNPNEGGLVGNEVIGRTDYSARRENSYE